MIKKLIVLSLALLLISCEKKPQTPHEIILGNWVEVKKKPNTDIMLPPPLGRDTLSYEFKRNGICSFKRGYFDFEKFYNDTSAERFVPYLGTKTKYKLNGKGLKIYDLSTKKWNYYKIKQLTSDSLLVDNGSEILFVKKRYSIDNYQDFDTVILSSSPCYGSCPVNNIMIDAKGNVNYQGLYHVKNIGYFTGKIKINDFNEIVKQFKQADYLNLKSRYFATFTDASTTYLTFVKNGKIIKSVEDYGGASPKEFVWAYDPLAYKAQHIKLYSQKSLKFLDTTFSKISFPRLNLDLYESEVFYLLCKLRTGRVISNKFDEKYEMYYYNKFVKKVMTDGRFYKFYLKDGTMKTIDIGFNFLTANINNKELNNN